MFIYMYVFHRRYTYRMRMRGNYVKRLRGMCTLCPLSGSIGSMNVFSCCGDWRRVCPSAELEIHVVRRREHLPTEIAEERETRLPRRCARTSHAYSVYFACSDSVFFFSCIEKSTSLWICHVHIRQRGTSFSSGTQTL